MTFSYNKIEFKKKVQMHKTFWSILSFGFSSV